MSSVPTQAKRTLSITTPLGKDALVLHAISGEEGVSTLFRFEAVAHAEDDSLDMSKVIGEGVTVSMTGDDGAVRYIHGICTGTSQVERTYRLELRPWFWQLSLEADCRVFQNKSAPDIAKAIFQELGFTDFKESLTSSYTAREYCVQYNETSLNFICRILEDEGIFWYFTHADGKHTLVLADDSGACEGIKGLSSIPYRPLPDEKAWLEADRIQSFRLERTLTSGKYQTDDYFYETPSTELKVSLTGDGTRRVYEFPGGYTKKDGGDSLGKIRLAALEADTQAASGTGTVRAMAAGLKFTLSNHPRSDANIAYVLYSVRHEAELGRYANAFTVRPADTVFRPPRRAHRPRIPGTQTAVVVGKSGEEIWTDSYGRIKIQFHWDQLGKKDENSSCWVRVAQGWAGKNWGSFFLPRIGQEVVVSFIDGDPDRPLVTGSVYNGEQRVPYTLPADQTKSTIKSNSSKGGGGYNEIRFEDKKDSEEVYVQAQKDMTVLVKNQRKTTVQEADDLLTLDKGNRKTTITEGNDTLTISKGNRTSEVTKGNESHTVGGTRTLKVTGKETHTSEADVSWTVGGNFTLKVDGSITIEAGGSVTIKAGSSLSVSAGSSGSIKAGTSMSVEGGTTFTGKAGTDATVQGTNATLKGSVDATVNGGVSANVKGSAMGTVDGGGMLTVKGGLVKIN